MQLEIKQAHDLLDDQGCLIESGWAKKLLLKYVRSKVHAGNLRIKEWDYYEIRNPDYGIVLLIYDVGYLANAQVTWLDFRNHTEEAITPLLLVIRRSTGRSTCLTSPLSMS